MDAHQEAKLVQHEQSVQSWINDLLSPFGTRALAKFSNVEMENLELLISTTISKLHHLETQTICSIDGTTDSTISSLPLALHDLMEVQKLGTAARHQIHSLHEKMDVMEARAPDLFTNIVQSNKIKTRIDSFLKLAQETDRWASLPAEFERVLDKQEWTLAATHLEDAKDNLNLLMKDCPDFSHRIAVISELQTQLETLVSVELQHALVKRDDTRVRMFHDVYRKIDRWDQCLLMYFDSRRTTLQSLWEETIQLALKSSFSSWDSLFPHFLQEAHAFMYQEHSWCCKVFTAASVHEVMLQFIQNVFEKLTPSISTFLSSYLNPTVEMSLPLLLSTHQAINSFYLQIEVILFDFDHSSLSSATQHQQEFRMIGKPLLQPFIAFYRDYGKMENGYSCARMKAICDENLHRAQHPTISEIAHGVLASTPLVLSLIDEVLNRCVGFTKGFGCLDALDALNHAFALLIDDLISQIRRLCIEHQIAGVRVLTAAPSAGTPQSNAHPATKFTRPRIISDDFDQLDEDEWSNDWSAFNSALKLVYVIAFLSRRIIGCESRLKLLLVSTAPEDFNLSFSNTVTLFIQQSGLATPPVREFMSNLTPQHPGTIDDASPTSSLSSTSPPNFSSLPKSPTISHHQPATATLTTLSQHLLFLVLFEPIRLLLFGLHEMDLWKTTHDTSRPSSAFHNLQVPSFSLSPIPSIHRVGEHLLSLPQQIEIHLVQAAEISSSFSTTPKHSPRDQIDDDSLKVPLFQFEPTQFTFNPSTFLATHSPNVPDATSTEHDSVTVAHQWIGAICTATLSFYVKDEILLMEPGSMTSFGAKQLLVDIEYLLNIISALGIWEENREEVELASIKAIQLVTQLILAEQEPGSEMEVGGSDFKWILKLLDASGGGGELEVGGGKIKSTRAAALLNELSQLTANSPSLKELVRTFIRIPHPSSSHGRN